MLFLVSQIFHPSLQFGRVMWLVLANDMGCKEKCVPCGRKHLGNIATLQLFSPLPWRSWKPRVEIKVHKMGAAWIGRSQQGRQMPWKVTNFHQISYEWEINFALLSRWDFEVPRWLEHDYIFTEIMLILMPCLHFTNGEMKIQNS